VHAADIQDTPGAKQRLLSLKTKHGRLTKIWADSRYRGELIEWVHGFAARKPPASSGWRKRRRR